MASMQDTLLLPLHCRLEGQAVLYQSCSGEKGQVIFVLCNILKSFTIQLTVIIIIFPRSAIEKYNIRDEIVCSICFLKVWIFTIFFKVPCQIWLNGKLCHATKCHENIIFVQVQCNIALGFFIASVKCLIVLVISKIMSGKRPLL